MNDTPTTGEKQGFQLKSASVTMTALELYEFKSADFEAMLREKISQAPGFFKEIPLILSLEKYQGLDSELDFFSIIGTCRRHHIHVVGVRGGNDNHRRMARNAELALIPGTGQRDREHARQPTTEAASPAAVPAAAPAPVPTPTPPAAVPTRIISQPVRSGQQVFAANSDLVILAPVQAGAEVMASGNIHIYGPLRGRALAGVNGDENARIFCQSLEAELVSIAGSYKISEDLLGKGWKSAVQLQLRDNLMVVTALGKA